MFVRCAAARRGAYASALLSTVAASIRCNAQQPNLANEEACVSLKKRIS